MSLVNEVQAELNKLRLGGYEDEDGNFVEGNLPCFNKEDDLVADVIYGEQYEKERQEFFGGYKNGEVIDANEQLSQLNAEINKLNNELKTWKRAHTRLVEELDGANVGYLRAEIQNLREERDKYNIKYERVKAKNKILLKVIYKVVPD